MTLSLTSWEGPVKEHPECLYHRILSNLQDNLLKEGSELNHNEKMPSEDWFLSPTVECLTVLCWMELIDLKLPQLVARTLEYDLQHDSSRYPTPDCKWSGWIFRRTMQR